MYPACSIQFLQTLMHSLSRLVFLVVLQTLLSVDGNIAEGPLLHPIDEEALEENEVREGQAIERTERVPCTIALAKVRSAPSCRLIALFAKSERKS